MREGMKACNQLQSGLSLQSFRNKGKQKWYCFALITYEKVESWM